MDRRMVCQYYRLNTSFEKLLIAEFIFYLVYMQPIPYQI